MTVEMQIKIVTPELTSQQSVYGLQNVCLPQNNSKHPYICFKRYTKNNRKAN